MNKAVHAVQHRRYACYRAVHTPQGPAPIFLTTMQSSPGAKHSYRCHTMAKRRFMSNVIKSRVCRIWTQIKVLVESTESSRAQRGAPQVTHSVPEHDHHARHLYTACLNRITYWFFIFNVLKTFFLVRNTPKSAKLSCQRDRKIIILLIFSKSKQKF